MSAVKVGSMSSAARLRTSVVLSSLVFALLLAQQPVQTQSPTQPDALQFFKNYFLTGDYVVAGVGLRGLGGQNGSPAGIATGTLNVVGVPADAEIMAAFLYWQVVSSSTLGSDSGAVSATFDGSLLSSADRPFSKVLDTAGTAPCWSSGGGTGSSGGQHLTYTYRADVRRFLRVDPTTGRLAVNGPHVVQLPDAGSNGNGVPVALGASLVVVYRDPGMPLKAVVLYDGGYTMNQTTDSMSQTIKGLYQAAGTTGKMTHILGSGQANKSENLRLPGTDDLTNTNAIVNPFTGGAGASWDNPTYGLHNVTVTSAGQYGDSVKTSVDHVGFSSFDCLTWGAIIFSTEVQDTDGDGLLDIWENQKSTTPGSLLKDPNGQPLPILGDMGADPMHKDVFIEIGYMNMQDADPIAPGIQLPRYGGVEKPVHSHLPSAEALEKVAKAFEFAPVGNPGLVPGIRVHFDVGTPEVGWDPDGLATSYLIPSDLARGGEPIDENVTLLGCPGRTCEFPDYPGTVGWKVGFKFYRDQLLSASPPALIEKPSGSGFFYDPCDGPVPGDPGDVTSWTLDGPGEACERRFDRNRRDMFRYVLGAHALGLAKSEFPCLDVTGAPTGAGTGGACAVSSNPDFSIPRTSSGVGDFPGADLMLTLGAFNDYGLPPATPDTPPTLPRPVGTPFMQASTLMHELGHTFDLGHSGVYVPGATAEPGCKPNYLSSMNYLFQLRGLFNDDPPLGTPRLDFSNEILAGINEVAPANEPLTVLQPSGGKPSYHTGWYAPLSNFTTGTAATKHCDGSPLLILRDAAAKPILDVEGKPTYLEPPMVRVDGPSAISLSSPWTSQSIDWNPDPDATPAQDINFDGFTASLPDPPDSPDFVNALREGSNDWQNLRLNQLATRRNVLGLSLDLGRDGLGRGETLGRDGLGRDGLGRDGLGRDGLGRDGLGRDGLGRDGLGRDGLGRDGLGRDGLGIAGLGRDGLGLEEVDTAIANASGHAPPNTFAACQILIAGCGELLPPPSPLPFHRVRAKWNATDVDPDLVVSYDVYRFKTSDGLRTATRVRSVPGPANASPPPLGTVLYPPIEYEPVDTQELPNGSFTYYAIAVFAGVAPGPSSPSNPLITIDVINDAPVPHADSYSMGQGTTLTIAAPGVLGNDTDDDSAVLTAALATAPSHGALTLIADGSFTYTPTPGFFGVDTFTYTVDDVDPSNARSATVSITVSDHTPPVVTLTVPAPNAQGWFTTKPVTVGVSATDPSTVTAISCVDTVNGTPIVITPSLSGAGTTTASGSLSLTAEGTHSFSCSATDGAGNTGVAAGSSAMPATVRIDTVAPTVTITAPTNNATPILKSSVASSFSCSDGTVPPASGLSSCVGTVANGSNINTATVGPKTFTVTATDVAGNTTTMTNNYTVIYAMTLQPLKTPANQGSAVPIQWALKDALGNSISSLATMLKMESVFNSAVVPAGGCVASATGTKELLYSPATGAAGGSNFRLVTGGYQFNWDTTTSSTAPIVTGKGCYTVLIYLNDRPDLTNPRITTPVQLK